MLDTNPLIATVAVVTVVIYEKVQFTINTNIIVIVSYVFQCAVMVSGKYQNDGNVLTSTFVKVPNRLNISAGTDVFIY